MRFNFTKKQLWSSVIVVILILVLLLGWSVYKKHKSSTYEQITTSKDTGQEIINTPNQTPEKGGGSGSVTVLGDGKFLSAGMTEAQFSLMEQLIKNYVNTQLSGRYSQVSILSKSLKTSGNLISAQMRLGSSSKLLNLTVKYHDLYYVEVIVNDPAGSQMYSYDSGDQQTAGSQTGE